MSVAVYRNTEPRSALLLATRTAYTQSSTIIADGFKGVHWWIDVTAASGTGGLTMQLITIDPIRNTILGGFIFHTAINSVILASGFIYPGARENQTNNIIASLPLIVPPRFRFSIIHADASNYTYSLNYAFIE